MKKLTQKQQKLAKCAGALALCGATLLPLMPAQAGYDVDRSQATGSYNSNVRVTGSGRPVYGTYARSVVITRRTSAGMIAPGSTLTVTGTLVEDADDKNFAIRDAWGQIWNIQTSRVLNAEATNKLQAGQTVRVYGTWTNGKVMATNVRDLGSGVAFGTRVQFNNRYYVIGQTTTLEGVLVSDADDDEFEVRDRSGVTTMVRTRLLPDALGANKLQEGQRVRVNGYWIADADGVQPQLEAMNLRIM